MLIKIENLEEDIIEKLKTEIFIYPTDTIYGIGCNTLNKTLVNKIRILKGRDNKPFSIIVPNIEFILKNFETTEDYIKKYLPGPYTLLLKKKNNNFLSHVSENEYIGIRIPNHKFTKIIENIGIPIITTSVNLSGEKPANSIEEINKVIAKKVPIIIDAGKLSGKPSTLIKDGKEIKR